AVATAMPSVSAVAGQRLTARSVHVKILSPMRSPPPRAYEWRLGKLADRLIRDRRGYARPVMPEPPRLAWQTSLFEESGAPRVDHDFRGLVHHRLDDAAWVDHVPGWLRRADEMFGWLLDSAPWEETE